MREYQEITNDRGQTVIAYEENGFFYSFPKDESNSDYQRYLRWLENPNEEDNGGLN